MGGGEGPGANAAPQRMKPLPAAIGVKWWSGKPDPSPLGRLAASYVALLLEVITYVRWRGKVTSGATAAYRVTGAP
jgi:hypothetical protein